MFMQQTNQKAYYHRLRLFLNEPGLLKHYLERTHSSSSKAENLKSIFPPFRQLDRFRHLQNARMSRQRDSALDGYLIDVVKKFEGEVESNFKRNKELQFKRENCLGKLKMDYVEEQMSQNLEELQKLIYEYEHYNKLISEERGFVEKMILTTEIKKALLIQNSILKKENEMLKKEEESIDTLISQKLKRV